MKRAVVVFSGGQDSTTCLVQALQQYDEVHCVTFDYGQRHRAEIDVARELALKLGARAHKVLDVTLLNELAVSSLTRDSIPVPDYEPEADGIPNTFVPGRNILFLTLAATVVLGEKLRLQKGLCVLMALCGMILISGVVGGGIPEARELTGIALGLGAACFYACVILCNKKLKEIGAYDKTIVQLLAAALVMVPYCALTGERFTAETFQPVSLACLLVLGMFHTGFAYALYFGSMKALRAQTIAIFSYIDPVIAILLSVTVLHELFTILSAVGSVLILGAAFVSEKT